MASFNAEFMNFVFKKLVPHTDGEKDYVSEREMGEARVKDVKKPLHCEIVSFNGVDGEIITPKKPNGKFILYVHGGGFTTGSAAQRRSITTYLAKKYNYTVIANNYRLSPENKWPSQLSDCMAFYEGMLENGYDPTKIIFMGESAGATLVLSMCLKLRDEKKPLPKGIASFSPATNQAEHYPSHKENVDSDYMLRDGLLDVNQNFNVFGVKNAKNKEYMKQPYISPVYGDFKGLPKVFLSASDYETLLDDSIELYNKLVKENHPVKLDIAHGVLHAYPMFPAMKEAKKTIFNAIEFLDN